MIAGFTHDQFGLVDDLFMFVLGWVDSLIKQKLGSCSPKLVFGLTHRGKGRGEHTGKLNIIVTHQGEVARYGYTLLVQPAHHTQRQ